MKSIEETKILVVGDIMLDKYVECKIERISPEAPVMVAEVINEYHTLGGCANVVRNLRELGVNVDCLSSIGSDIDGEIIKEELKNINTRSLLFYGSDQTTVKERIVANERKVQMIRIDRETIKPIEAKFPIDIFVRMCHEPYDMIVISDYAKGVVSRGLMEFLKSEQNANIIVDPKPKNSGIYNGVFMITPNEKEWREISSSSTYNLNNVKYILETKGDRGMTLVDNINKTSDEIASIPIPVFNVSGCGDVVVAVISGCIAIGMDELTSAKIANKCAGFTATLPGTSIITKEKFNIYMKELIETK